ncbi:MAG TPA: galactokinase [Anaerolineales bacterium]|nr:galactokinase [Anaerolineales bacterium]
MSARRVFRAPGRVNLIGEHTDYNEGLVLPAAVDLECRVTATPAADGRLRARTLDLGREQVWPLERMEPRGDWSDYVAGVAVELAQLGIGPVAAELEIHSTVPIGAGLSSSAALEVAVGMALCGLAGARLEPVELALACQRAENEFVGMKCGIMDQFIAVLGRRDHALRIDCRTLEYRAAPLPAGCEIVTVNTMVRHELASSEYNQRREECQRAAAQMGRPLREATAAQTESLAELERRRARHVISENDRVERFIAACAAAELEEAGRLLYASHASLRDDYQVSCPELDFLVEAARGIEGVVGARMMGGGFGGSTINLVRPGAVASFRRRISAAYREQFGVEPQIWAGRTADGAGEVR